MKTKTLVVSYPHSNPGPQVSDEDNWRYRVEQVKNTIDLEIGELLSRKSVEELCDMLDWEVIIKRSP